MCSCSIAKVDRVNGKLTKSNDASTLHPMPRKIIVTKRLEKNQGQKIEGLASWATYLIAYAGTVAHMYMMPAFEQRKLGWVSQLFLYLLTYCPDLPIHQVVNNLSDGQNVGQ